MTPTQSTSTQQSRSNQISGLVEFARSNYQENPSEALSALMEALTLNSGSASADAAMARIRSELGVATQSPYSTQRAMEIIQEIMNDESTFLHQRGKQHLLQQAMEDGSSVICSRCNGMVATARWEQHLNYWCPSNNNSIQDDDDDEIMS